MTKTYKTCPGPGWYWCRLHAGGKKFLHEFRGGGLVFTANGHVATYQDVDYTDFEPVSIVPREIEEKMTRGEDIVVEQAGVDRSSWREDSLYRRLADAIDKVLDEEREKAVGEWLRCHGLTMTGAEKIRSALVRHKN